jgi:hypothetical protein
MASTTAPASSTADRAGAANRAQVLSSSGVDAEVADDGGGGDGQQDHHPYPAPGNPAAWLLTSAYGLAAASGLCWGVVLRARRPAVYRQIGLGPEAGTARSAFTALGAQS